MSREGLALSSLPSIGVDRDHRRLLVLYYFQRNVTAIQLTPRIAHIYHGTRSLATSTITAHTRFAYSACVYLSAKGPLLTSYTRVQVQTDPF